jgi:hypothetical protein
MPDLSIHTITAFCRLCRPHAGVGLSIGKVVAFGFASPRIGLATDQQRNRRKDENLSYIRHEFLRIYREPRLTPLAQQSSFKVIFSNNIQTTLCNSYNNSFQKTQLNSKIRRYTWNLKAEAK